MKCKFCNNEMTYKTKTYDNANIIKLIQCNNHNLVRVSYYKYSYSGKDKWSIFHDKYVLQFYENKTFFQKVNVESDSPEGFFLL